MTIEKLKPAAINLSAEGPGCNHEHASLPHGEGQLGLKPTPAFGLKLAPGSSQQKGSYLGHYWCVYLTTPCVIMLQHGTCQFTVSVAV